MTVHLPRIRDVIHADDGVILRKLTTRDFPELIQHCRDPEMVRWTMVPDPYTEDDASGFLEHVNSGWSRGSFAGFVIEKRGEYAGTCHLAFRRDDSGSVGCGLTPAARGTGTMRVALRTLLGWGFTLGTPYIAWEALVGNFASIRLAEQLGFTGFEEHVLVQRGKSLPAVKGSLLANQFRM